MKELIDQLSWLEFLKNSKDRKEFPKKVDKYNRLIAHSKNSLLFQVMELLQMDIC